MPVTRMASNPLHLTDWLDSHSKQGYKWYVKRLSGNDTLANGSHQAGPYIEREFLFDVLPELKRVDELNPDIRLNLLVDSHGDEREVRVIWYNNKLFQGTRNEARMTRLGGKSSALLDPENTGGLTVFIFDTKSPIRDRLCNVWVCRDESEEEQIECHVGIVEPGKPRPWSLSPQLESPRPPRTRTKPDCWLEREQVPKEWEQDLPSGEQIIFMALERSRRSSEANVDDRLLARRECEFNFFRRRRRGPYASENRRGIR